MSAGRYDIVIDQGSDFALEMIMKEDGVVKDLTTYSARADIRSTKNSDQLIDSFTCTIPEPLNGKIKMELDNIQTGNITAGRYKYDLEIYTGPETLPTFVARLIEGSVTVTREITR
jgi:hypothetical protein